MGLEELNETGAGGQAQGALGEPDFVETVQTNCPEMSKTEAGGNEGEARRNLPEPFRGCF